MEEHNARFIGFLRLVREDLKIQGQDWTRPGFRAVAVHRFGTWLRGLSPGLCRSALFWLYRAMHRYVRNHYGIELHDTTTIGRRFWIGHSGGIVIHERAQIGDDCMIRQNVTIGAASHVRAYEAPKLGNRVQVGCGAVIIGNIRIGDDVCIGPNALVMTDVPEGATVFAPSARIILLTAKDKGKTRSASMTETASTSGGEK